MANMADKVIDVVERVTEELNTRAVRPAKRLARLIIYGMLAAFLATIAFTVLLIGLFRVLSGLVPTWIAYMILGATCVAGGVIIWSLKTGRVQDAS